MKFFKLQASTMKKCYFQKKDTQFLKNFKFYSSFLRYATSLALLLTCWRLGEGDG